MSLQLDAKKGTLKDGIMYCGKDGACFIKNTMIKDSDKYIVAELTNLEDVSVVVYFAFWSKGEEPDLMIKCGLFPKIKTQIAFPLEYIDGNQLFLPPEGVRMKSIIVGIRANRDEVTKVGIITEPHFKDIKIKADCFYLGSEYNFEKQPEIKLVDELGQWKSKDWQGKTKSIDELSEKLNAQLKKADDFKEFKYDDDISFKATGYFRIEKVGGRFCLVTPEGKPFFSSGIDCIRNDEPGRTNGLDGYFDYLPKDDPEIWSTRKIHTFEVSCISFVRSNFKRIFGDKWQENWNKYLNYKLKSWGFNTIAAWSDEDFINYSNMPYTAFLNNYPTTKNTIYRDFPDVFSDEYKENAKEYAKQLEAYKADKNLIGYFMSNEPNFAFVGGLNIAAELLKNTKDFVSKQYLIKFFEERYNSDISVLNSKWETSFASFDDLRKLNTKTRFTEDALSELDEFSKLLIKEYIKIPALELKKVDPNHLNLGIRFAWVSTPTLYSGSEYVDVYSINSYTYSCCDDVNEIYKHTGKPVIIGEYHFGATDRGLPATGIKSGKNQEQRAVAIRYYLENAIANPYCVGTHYFQLYDQHVLGRADGEDYQIGLLDVCSMEHKEVVETCADIHSKMYKIMFGKLPPTSVQSEKIKAIFY